MKLNTENPSHFFDELLQGSKPVLVDFYANWCEPCKWLEPVLDEVRDRIGNSAAIHKIDIEKFPGLKEKYMVMSVPVLIIFKNGSEVWRMNGFTHAKELHEHLLRYI